MRNPVAKYFNKFNRASTHVDRKKQSVRNPELDPIEQCYKCGDLVESLSSDYCCYKCTKYTPEEVQMTDEESSVQQTYDEVLSHALELFTNDVNPLEIAASLVNVGLSFYKTVLEDEDDYNLMVDTISERRHEVANYSQDTLDSISNDRVLH